MDEAQAQAQQQQANLAAFRAALGRIGFTPVAQDALNQNGFNGMYNLMIFSKEQIKGVCKVIRENADNPIPISMEQEQFLTAMRHWVKTRVRTNRDISPELFTRDVAIAEAIKLVNVAEEAATEKDSDVKMPDKFKFTSKWIVFAEAVDTYLNRLRGQGRVPLNYVLRTQEVPIPGTIYATEQEMIISTAPLAGDLYDLDNERVFGIIKQLILEGPAWAYITAAIDRVKDGRGAWLALRAHYEGESFLNKQKEEAYKVIESLHYKGERATFTFEHFTGLLTKAYNDLQRYGEPVLEVKKVRDLLNKITDPKLESAKQAVRINHQYKNDFSLAINFLSETVEPMEKGKTRMISEVTHGHQGRHGHGSGGRTGGRNYSRGRGTSTRGRGRNTRGGGRQHGGHGRGGRRSETTNTYVPPAEWRAMTAEQRQAFLQARAMSRISALTTTGGVPDDVSALTSVVMPSNAPTQVAQIQTASVPGTSNAAAVSSTSSNSGISGPFGGRAAHRG